MEKWIDEAFARACEKMERGAKRASEQGIIPYMGQKDGYSPAPFDGNSWWTGGFWPGMMWQLYAATGKDVYKDEALRVENLLTAELRSFMLLNHDVGFMYLLSTGAHDRLIGDAQAYADTLHAATLLAGRFNPTGFIRAWPQPDRAGYAIIDCMMNLNLLYWASKKTGDPRFEAIARIHADTTIREFIREDGLTDCDFRQPKDEERIDNIAGACAACGLLELANVVGGDEAEAYRAAAMKLLTALNTLCADWTDGNMGILQKCTASYHNDGAGRHVNILYGDYFFIEALCKLRGTDAKLWMA